ncbi:MAG: hypothetical protein M3R24_22730 [Chloroflexota bacterium]|nr:hypothetical protein [Chloroflexota bacterium]
MTTVRSLHDEAMNLAQLALVARHTGDIDQATILARQAFEHERQAAELVPEGLESEPTRSIMYRSAASLAYQCREYRIALQLIAKGLAGYPPPRVEQELHILFEQVRFELNLQNQGMVLADTDMQMTMKGKAVGYGQIIYTEFSRRVDVVFTLFDRTVQRKMGRQYVRGGRVPDMYRPFRPVLSAPGAGSFIVNISLASVEAQQLSFLVTASEVINEILTGIELLNDGQADLLRQLIPAQEYYQNFITLARELAPDGDQISTVDFSSGERKINLARQREDIDLVPHPQLVEPDTDRIPVKVEGVLDFASGRKADIIGLTTEDGRTFDILMKEGFDDLVRTYWKKVVVVSGWLEGKQIDPTDIKFSDR